MKLDDLKPGDVIADTFSPGTYTIEAVSQRSPFAAALYRASDTAKPVQAIVWDTELRDFTFVRRGAR